MKNIQNSEKLWDEILKVIARRMSNQILPLIKEVFGIEYPLDVKIIELPTELTLPQTKDFKKLTSIYSDVTLMIEHDIYHLECQIKNDDDMSIRMMKYDFHIGLSTSNFDEDSNTIVFPKSCVIYPAPNDSIPDTLTCHLAFPDGSKHDYTVPTLKVQKYSLEEIREKHLTMFLPYKLLQFRPRLKSKTNPITKDELTAFTNGIIVILKEELNEKRITEKQYNHYVELINMSAERVFCHHNDYREQVISMTNPLITFKTDEYENQIESLSKTLAEKDAQLFAANKLSNEKDAEIADLKRQLEEALEKLK